MPDFRDYQKAQSIALQVLEKLGPTIVPSDTEHSIANRAAHYLAELGVSQTWYHDCPALVLLGDRSCMSISGRHYRPAEYPVGNFNLVTVDLSPEWRGAWGDCARGYFVESGRYVETPSSDGFRSGLEIQQHLHAEMSQFVSPNTTFAQLYEFSNDLILEKNYRNQDFQKNLGHSIEMALDDRQFIEKGNNAPLGSVRFFTFEPHIRHVDGPWGFKHENIYYFDSGGVIQML